MRNLAAIETGTLDAGDSIHLHYKSSELILALLSHIKQELT